MKNKARIYLSPPHMSGEEQKYIEEAFASNWIAPLGPHVNGFEKELASYLGVEGALALNSGTAAMHLALLLAGVKKGSPVFCSALTFAASVNPVLYEEAEPVFIDSEPGSWNMCPEALKQALLDAKKLGRLPVAVIAVNLYGQSADLEKIRRLCRDYKVYLIEDAAESLGASYRDKKSGSLGDFGVLSFNGNKIITTSGGGALVSGDRDALKRARFLSTQAREPARHYEHLEVGYNYRLSNVLAGIGRAQLQVLDERVKARRKVFDYYREALVDLPGVKFMPEAEYGYSSRWLSVITLEASECGATRDKVIEALEKENIEARPVWKPMQLQPLYKSYPYYPHREDMSVSERLFETGVCLPSGSNLSEADLERIVAVIRRFF